MRAVSAQVWSVPIVGDPEVDTTALKEAAGLIPPKEKPVKVSDPKVLAELAREHPDLDLSALAGSGEKKAAPFVAKVGVQAETTDEHHRHTHGLRSRCAISLL